MRNKLMLPLLACTLLSMNSCGNKNNDDSVSLDYEKYVLANGLEVVLHHDDSDPVVSVAIQYHVGSNREKPGKTGFAHFFEHMLFQRSENLPRNAFFQKIDAMGGTFNGGTSNDGTVYYETVPRDALEKVLWMESDRMGYFINTVTEGGLKREIDVVSNEKRQGENAPYGLAFDLVFKNLFPEGHPYSWTVIGEIPDLRSATVEDVKEFYERYYLPGNATLVVAGDFDPAQTKALIEKYFGEIPARPVPEAPKTWNVEVNDLTVPGSEAKISYRATYPENNVQTASFSIENKGNLDTLKFRAGPFTCDRVTVNGTVVRTEPAGDARWAWITVDRLQNGEKYTFNIRP